MALRSILRRTWAALLLPLAMLGAAGAVAADSTYQDPRRPSFRLLVPDGWTAAQQDDGVLIRQDDNYFMLRVQPGNMAPGAVMMQIRPQLERQRQGFRERAAGRVSFGGLDGVFGEFEGTPPSGVPSVTRIVVAGNGVLVYSAFQSVKVGAPDGVRQQLQRIERSFQAEPAR